MELPKVRTDEVVRAISEQFNAQTDIRHYSNDVRFSFYNHHDLTEALASGRAVDLQTCRSSRGRA